MRKPRPRCPRCRNGGFTQDKAPDGRPRFTCSRCDHTWTAGKTGGDYTEYLRNIAKEEA